MLPTYGVQALLLATGSIQAALPVIAAVFTGVIACWIRAVSILHNTIKVLLQEDPLGC
jgi:ATP/ADP translocase